ncbi:MAG: DUF6472 family protein [Oscillospiraceae bacterium]|jgi:hypothetical protein
MSRLTCEDCCHYDYDEECDSYVCLIDLDEDEQYRFLQNTVSHCPYFRRGDAYTTARKQ